MMRVKSGPAKAKKTKQNRAFLLAGILVLVVVAGAVVFVKPVTRGWAYADDDFGRDSADESFGVVDDNFVAPSEYDDSWAEARAHAFALYDEAGVLDAEADDLVRYARLLEIEALLFEDLARFMVLFDTDGDGVPDLIDVCPSLSNPDQEISVCGESELTFIMDDGLLDTSAEMITGAQVVGTFGESMAYSPRVDRVVVPRGAGAGQGSSGATGGIWEYGPSGWSFRPSVPSAPIVQADLDAVRNAGEQKRNDEAKLRGEAENKRNDAESKRAGAGGACCGCAVPEDGHPDYCWVCRPCGEEDASDHGDDDFDNTCPDDESSSTGHAFSLGGAGRANWLVFGIVLLAVVLLGVLLKSGPATSKRAKKHRALLLAGIFVLAVVAGGLVLLKPVTRGRGDTLSDSEPVATRTCGTSTCIGFEENKELVCTECQKCDSGEVSNPDVDRGRRYDQAQAIIISVIDPGFSDVVKQRFGSDFHTVAVSSDSVLREIPGLIPVVLELPRSGDDTPDISKSNGQSIYDAIKAASDKIDCEKNPVFFIGINDHGAENGIGVGIQYNRLIQTILETIPSCVDVIFWSRACQGQALLSDGLQEGREIIFTDRQSEAYRKFREQNPEYADVELPLDIKNKIDREVQNSLPSEPRIGLAFSAAVGQIDLSVKTMGFFYEWAKGLAEAVKANGGVFDEEVLNAAFIKARPSACGQYPGYYPPGKGPTGRKIFGS